jgi:hypothetical protein
MNTVSADEAGIAVLESLQCATRIERRLTILGEYGTLAIICIGGRGECRRGAQQERASGVIELPSESQWHR